MQIRTKMLKLKLKITQVLKLWGRKKHCHTKASHCLAGFTQTPTTHLNFPLSSFFFLRQGLESCRPSRPGSTMFTRVSWTHLNPPASASWVPVTSGHQHVLISISFHHHCCFLSWNDILRTFIVVGVGICMCEGCLYRTEISDVSGSYEPPDMILGTKIGSSANVVGVLRHWAIITLDHWSSLRINVSLHWEISC